MAPPRPLGPDHTVCCTGTFRDTPLRAQIGAAAAAGFDALSVRPRHVDAVLDAGHTLDDVAGWFAAAGLAVAEVDPVSTWLPGPTHDVAASTAVLDLAARLDGDCVTVLWLPGIECSPGDAAAGLRDLCDLAAERGVRLAVEPFAWSPLRTLAETRRLVDAVARPELGLIVDLWHHARSGGTTAELAALDGRRVWGIQVADAPAAPVLADVAEECRLHRRWPDEGDLPLRARIDALRTAGSTAPLAVEVFDGPGPTADPHARARTAFAALARLERDRP